MTHQHDQESSEDFSYDLAHELKSGNERLEQPRSVPRTAARREIGDTEPDGDYGYDEAHHL